MSFLGKDVNKILIKIKKGDEESKNVLFNKTFNHFKKIAVNYVRNNADIEDVVIDSYCKAFQSLNTFDFKKDGYNWICKIIQNTAYDYNKKYTREFPFEEIEKPLRSVEYEGEILLKDEVERALSAYSQRDREMMYLRFWKNEKIEEIAEDLHMSKSNVHKRLKIILSEMSEKLKNKVEK